MNRSNPTFVFSRHEYESYRDFWELVRLSGFKSTPFVEADLSRAGVYICPSLDVEFMKWTSARPKGKRAAKVVFWNLERPDAHLRPGMDPMEMLRRGNDEILEMADEVWVSDRGLHAADPRMRFAVMGGHLGLFQPPEGMLLKERQVVHIGQLTPRRRAVLEDIEKFGIPVVRGTWDWDRIRCLASSVALVSIDRIGHMNVSAPLRWAVAASYGLPILSEWIKDPFPLKPGRSVFMAPWEGIPWLVSDALKDPDLVDRGREAWRVFCEEWTFRRGVEEALAASP